MESAADAGSESGIPWKSVALGAASIAAVGGLGYLAYSALSQEDEESVRLGDSSDGISAASHTASDAASSKSPSLILKESGNNLFKSGQYRAAVAAYTEAIEQGAGEDGEVLGTCYQNRAAAYEKLGEHKEVLADCDSAIEANPRYAKAYSRRGRAKETMGQPKDALEDFTAACILEQFTNYNTMVAADRVLKVLSEEKAKALFSQRGSESVPLSLSFVDSYLQSFCEDPLLNSLRTYPAVQENGDKDDTGALDALKSLLKTKDYPQVLPELNRLIAIPDLSQKEKLEVLMLRATFGLIQGNAPQATKDFEDAFELIKAMPQSDYTKKMMVNGLVKRGSFYMQQGKREECLRDFGEAEKTDATNADIYHHRGQLLMLMGEPTKAVEDFTTCLSHRPDFDLAKAQGAFAEYRAATFNGGSVSEAYAGIQKLEKMVEEMGNCAEGWALLGQVYMERQSWDDANAAYDKALELSPGNANIHVHKGLLILQRSEGDLTAARTEMEKALVMDPHCEFAYETLGTLEVQRGDIPAAMDFFDKALKLARTELEVTHLISLKEAALTQVTVSKKLGLELQAN